MMKKSLDKAFALSYAKIETLLFTILLPMEQIIQEIEYGIMVGEFRPKQRLVEAELMHRFSAGRGIIRDSLKILADRGLVCRNENKGVTVRDLLAKDIRDIYFLRSQLEGIAAELAFDSIRDQEVQRLSNLQKGLREYDRVDRKLVKMHEALHETIFKASGNKFLVEQINRLIAITGSVRYFSYTHEDQRVRSLDDHDKMIQSLKSRRKDEFVTLCRNHVIPGMEAYIKLFYPHESTG